MEKTQKKQRQYSVEFKLCAILDKFENGLNYFETVRKHWNLSTAAESQTSLDRGAGGHHPEKAEYSGGFRILSRSSGSDHLPCPAVELGIQ